MLWDYDVPLKSRLLSRPDMWINVKPKGVILCLDTCFNRVVPGRILSGPLLSPSSHPDVFSLPLRMFCSPVGRESVVAAALPRQMGHCQEVMSGKHLLLQRAPLIHSQPFDTTYAAGTYKTKRPRRETAARR